MGRGIAQLAAQAGSDVVLFDSAAGAASGVVEALRQVWAKQVAKGRMSEQALIECMNRLTVATTLDALAGCRLVIEAIREDLDLKKSLFEQIESVVDSDAILATNTSSLSITAIAAALRNPDRFAGLHFFNPVPLMKVVEVVRGLRTSQATCEQLAAYVGQMGHTAVLAQDSPGFIVNHAGRGYGTEALRLVSEGVCDYATADRILTQQAGFRLGPFELLDLTGLDVSHPVMTSIYHQYFEEARYRPSPITTQRLAGGVLGRKSGEGFYIYVDGVAQAAPEPAAPTVEGEPMPVWVPARATRRQELLRLLNTLGAKIETGASPTSEALILVAPLGFDVTTVAAVDRLDATRTLGIDMLVEDQSSGRRVLATNPATRADMARAAHALLARDGKPVSVIRDSGGFVTQRVIASIVNIACDMCQQAICSPSDLDRAVTLGLGYPNGPLAMGNLYGPTNMLEVLFNMQTVYGDPRYRPSPWLRRRGALGLSLLHEEERF